MLSCFIVILYQIFSIFMQEQNFKNHARIAPVWYYAGIGMAGVVTVFSLIYSENYNEAMGGSLVPVLFVDLAIGLSFTAWYARAFALKAQDRAIRAEENLRHFALTGKLLDSKLTISQIIALRFAADDEFPELAHKAAANGWSNKEIKKAIKNWKADHYRV